MLGFDLGPKLFFTLKEEDDYDCKSNTSCEVKKMGAIKKLEALEAAKRFISTYFPDCQGALLAGSVVRGEATDTSDLDIVVFDNSIRSAYRESLIEFGWPIEVFVHNFTSYQHFLHGFPEGKAVVTKNDRGRDCIKRRGIDRI
jgi:hypothetical protein